jgi:arylsulfatase B
VIMVIADDLGWFNAGFTQQQRPSDPTTTTSSSSSSSSSTPRLRELAASGAVLGRLYSFFYCSPARSAVLTGRLPVHVFDAGPSLRLNVVNRTAPTTGVYGIPVGMSTVATVLAHTHLAHMVGKYDVGFANESQMPAARGFTSFYGYLGGEVGYWSAEAAGIFSCQPAAGDRVVDLWDGARPAASLPGFVTCVGQDSVTCGGANASSYLESIFVQRAESIIAAHAAAAAAAAGREDSKRLLLYYGQHVAHAPLQTPLSVLRRFSALKNANRRIYASQVAVCDSAVGSVVDSLRQHKLWAQSLFLFFSDNGGPSYAGGPASASNFPLRGSKLSDWEGGVRVAGLVAGGFFSEHKTRPAGTVLSGLMHVADILATVCAASGVQLEKGATDGAAAMGTDPALPALDSISMWNYWTGSQPLSPRTELQISAQTLLQWVANDTTSVTSANRLLKLMVGDVPYACWSGTDFPTGSAADRCSTTVHCGTTGCLFDVLADEREQHPLAGERPATLAKMVARLAQLNGARFEPDRGTPDPAACLAADKYGGVAGPWMGVADLPPSPPPPPPPPPPSGWSLGIPGKYFAQCPDLHNLAHETVALCQAACDAHARCNTININTQSTGPDVAKCALRACPCGGPPLVPQGTSPNVTAYQRTDRPCPPQPPPLPPAPPCVTDTDCLFTGAFRCCGLTKAAENCVNPPYAVAPPGDTVSGGNCTLPGTEGSSQCVCRASRCSAMQAAPPTAGKKQWLMIGDSISLGCLGPAKQLAALHDIEVVHTPGNAANVWWGAHCLDSWLHGAARWDVISYNFGLHDLAMDNERIEPDAYSHWIANLTQRLADAAPQARLVWASTTPVPLGIDGFCNKSTLAGGCPPRKNSDPPVFNAAAAEAIASTAAAARVSTLDLYSVVTKTCGVRYSLCPEGCTAHRENGTWVGDCFQIPHNVHYLPKAWDQLASAYVSAVVQALTN